MKQILEEIAKEARAYCNEVDEDCSICNIQKFADEYNIQKDDIYCTALYLLIKTFGANQDTVNYYLSQIDEWRKTCDYQCADCDKIKKYGFMPCLFCHIGEKILREI